MGRTRDAEAELNLPPGFRFHPTDDELVAHYLCRKIAYQCLPVPIIADVDLYKYDPWELPEKALFGQREWYFFTPRDRKYPNGSRPNRAAGRGYWKATGADKPLSPGGRTLAIKKALVFYSGKAPKGIKTDWIMHEYRLARTSSPADKKGTLRLDDWVLCRLYNKKNSWDKSQHQQKASFGETIHSLEAIDDTGSESFRTLESDIENDVLPYFDDLVKPGAYLSQPCNGVQLVSSSGNSSHEMVDSRPREDNEWLMDLSLDDLRSSFLGFGSTLEPNVPNQEYYFPALASPQLRPGQTNIIPF